MSAICIIPARGGSKRIPRKNVRDFLGKPILAYSIEAALGSGLFDEVMVSTDDGEIAGIARSSGASVPFMRSADTAGDMSTTADVLLEVLGRYAESGRSFDVVCCVYATAPFVTPGRIREAFGLLGEGIASVVSATPFSFPPQRGLALGGDGSVRWWMPEYANERSQDLLTIYHDAGQLYLVRARDLARERSLICSPCAMLELPESEVQDIDNESDWAIAEMKYERMMAHAQARG